MSIQSTFANQSFYPVRNVSAANCTSPIDGEIPGEADGDWTRITEDDRVEKAPNAYYPEFLCQDCADQEEVEEKQDENRSLGEF
jgi:hypothetical protein